MKLLVLVLVLVASPVLAQNHEGIVRSVKDQLQATGVSLSGPCGAFQITMRVAWILRGETVGLLHKRPEQNNCQGYGVDVVMYADGRLVDILTDSGGANGPVWHPIEAVSSTLWRPAIDPGGSTQPEPPPGQPPTPTPIPPPAPIDLSHLATLAQVERVFADLTKQIAAARMQLVDHDERLRKHDEEPGFLRKLITNPLVLGLISGALGTWGAQKATD